MKVLLAGGAGYIGSHTAVEVMKLGHDIVVADDFSNSKPEALNRMKTIAGRDFPFYQIDVADRNALEKLFAVEKPDAVIHFAGYKAVGESVEKPLAYYRNNLDTTLTLLETMKKYDCHRFIFSSSATVYGAPDEVPIRETAAVGRCTNPYGWTKYMIELILKDAAAADASLSVVLLRYFNPVGAHESGLIGEDPQGIPNNLMPYISQVAIGKLPYLSVFGDDYPTKDGTGVRDYIHVVDLARGHAYALDYAAGQSLFSAEEMAEMQRQDSIANVASQRAEQAQKAAEAAQKAQAIATAKSDTASLFYPSLNGTNKQVVLKNGKHKIRM